MNESESSEFIFEVRISILLPVACCCCSCCNFTCCRNGRRATTTKITATKSKNTRRTRWKSALRDIDLDQQQQQHQQQQIVGCCFSCCNCCCCWCCCIFVIAELWHCLLSVCGLTGGFARFTRINSCVLEYLEYHLHWVCTGCCVYPVAVWTVSISHSSIVISSSVETRNRKSTLILNTLAWGILN